MNEIKYTQTKSDYNLNFKPREKLDLNEGYIPITPISGVQPIFRPESVVGTIETVPDPAQGNNTNPEIVQNSPEPEHQPEARPKPKKSTVKRGTIVANEVNVGNMQHILDKFAEAGINVRVTSGLRDAGKAGKAGSKSHHVAGNAIDIVPGSGETFESMRQKIKNNPALLKYFRDHRIGIIDETTEEAMRRTGATGKHWHIGPDRLALSGFETMFAKQGGSILSRVDMLVAKFNQQFNK